MISVFVVILKNEHGHDKVKAQQACIPTAVIILYFVLNELAIVHTLNTYRNRSLKLSNNNFPEFSYQVEGHFNPLLNAIIAAF